MRTAFASLLSVRFRHSFYASGRSERDFEAQPAPATSRALEALGLVFRPGADGFNVYAEIVPGSLPPELRTPLDPAALRLRFLLYPLTPDWINISSLPSHRPGGEAFYFNNLRQDTAGGLSHLGDSVAGARVGPPLRLVTGTTLSHRFAAPAEAATVEIRDLFGNTLHRTAFRSPPGAGRASELRIELVAVPRMGAGAYAAADSQGGSARFLYEPELTGPRPLAVLELFGSTTALAPGGAERVPAAYRPLSGARITGGGAYVVQIERRSTVWRYNVVKRYASNGIALNKLSISGPVAFGRSIAAGRAVFTSTAAVPLADQPPALALEHEGKKIRDLPAPRAGTMLQAGAAPGSFVSEVFVYV